MCLEILILYVLINVAHRYSNSFLTLPGHKPNTTENRAEQREHLSQHYAITLTQEMVHSQGISLSNLFIHFLQRGNLTHDLIHLCDVAEMPAALRDTSCIFGPQINTESQKYWIAAKQRRGAAERRGGGGSQMLSLAISLFNLQPYIAHFKDRHILFAHDPRVSKNISEFKTRQKKGRDCLVGAQPALIH